MFSQVENEFGSFCLSVLQNAIWTREIKLHIYTNTNI